jgi:predicted nucleic acid binding AN1-type Zn finger protein
MTNNALGPAIFAVALAISGQALARAPAPLVPTALVEDVKSASADVEFMDYVGTGQVIKLEPSDVLVLSYLKSCEHETITGGTVRVGRDKSEVDGGKIARAKVPCNGGNMKLSSQQANASAASSFRLQNAAFEPTVYALPPVIELPKMRAGDSRNLVIERAGRPSERFALELDESLVNGGFYDLAKTDMRLQRGKLYTATLGDRKFTFKVDAKAKTGNTPLISRLLRFPPG